MDWAKVEQNMKLPRFQLCRLTEAVSMAVIQNILAGLPVLGLQVSVRRIL